jgi:arabinose-5-phosphate isomerase
MVRDRLPTLSLGATMREAVVLLAERRGIVMVLDDEQRLAGVVTAGDLTRLMEREREFLAFPVESVMTREPKTAVAGELGSGAVYRMERHGIMALPVVNDVGGVDGLVHLHDLLRAGVA